MRGLIVAALAISVGGAAHAADLSFEGRVRAQQAIERVYYSHQIGVTMPFEEAVPRRLLERKVHDYLGQSSLLEERWKTPVTARMLHAEWNRIARGTRMPGGLQELYDALGNDPVMIQECLVRPVLVDRLARSFFSMDPRIHGRTSRRAERWRAGLLSGRDALSGGALHSTPLDIVRDDPRTPDTDNALPEPHGPLRVAGKEFGEWRSRLPREVGEIGPVREERDRFVFYELLEIEAGHIRAVVRSIDKRGWRSWWDGERAHWSGASPSPVAESIAAPQLTSRLAASGQEQVRGALSGGPDCPLESAWDNGILDDLPEGRRNHTAVWSGSHMLVWGGGPSSDRGARYDPATDTWTAMATLGAPEPRRSHTAVWTGSMMVVWGGLEDTSGGTIALGSGGRYDPATDTWLAMTTVNAPSPRYSHTAVWTGTRMIVWGGSDLATALATGGRYDPVTDTWTPTSTTGAPSARRLHITVWTGSRMIIWGGVDASGYPTAGGRYDPVHDTWSGTSLLNAPSGRLGLSGVWTGTELIIWGGSVYGQPYFGGSRYDPATDYWSVVSSSGPNVPELRSLHSAVWTGSRMIVYGGQGQSGYLTTGGKYNPLTDSWSTMSSLGAPQSRIGQTAVWTGNLMIVWGGGGLDTGGRYDPAADAWTPTSTIGAPLGRAEHDAIWTGNLMLIWGGWNSSDIQGVGGRYDPVLDAWAPMSSVDAPSPRWAPALWTGNRLFVWGGSPNNTGIYYDDGGLYDPIADVWTPTSMIDAPSPRRAHTAVWTGAQVIIWGGEGPLYTSLNTGARFDPLSNVWTPLTTAGAPSVRSRHLGFWAGSRMVVWGGYSSGTTRLWDGGVYDPVVDSWVVMSTTGIPQGLDGFSITSTGSEIITWGGRIWSGGSYMYLDTGGRFDPGTNVWTPTSTLGAASARGYHSAVWTGGSLIIWGGVDSNGGLDSGAIYDPASDLWVPMTTVAAPAPRSGIAGLWTGKLMIVWGGDSDGALDTGGAYEPATDTWMATPMMNAPSPRMDHSAVWTGDELIVWGGKRYSTYFNGGGRLGVAGPADFDGDGLAVCTGDCDESSPAVYTGAPQVCDGLNNDCASPSWPDLDGTNEADADGDGLSECAGDCDDTNAATYPGAPEINDGADNQCAGDPGFGTADEIPNLEFPDPNDASLLCWSAQQGATDYGVRRAESASFPSPCLWSADLATTCWADPLVPPIGRVEYYLVNVRLPNTGSFGVDSAGVERVIDCDPFVCGNGILEPPEKCDGADLGGVTCESLGGTGVLACRPTCDHYDLTGCQF